MSNNSSSKSRIASLCVLATTLHLANANSALGQNTIGFKETGTFGVTDSTIVRDETANSNSVLASSTIAKGENILASLERSNDPQDLLEATRVRLNPESPFHDHAIGLKLVKTISGFENKEVRGQAAMLLGLTYAKSGPRWNKEAAVKWLERAVSLGTHQAHVELGDFYANQRFEKENLQNALKHYQAAAEVFSVAPLIAFARRIERLSTQGYNCGIDPEKVARKHIPQLKSEASKGNARAAKELGRLFLKGTFVEKDINQAAKWLQSAAAIGDTGALHDLAKVHLINRNSENDYGRAVALLHDSASRGNGAAYSALAKLYLNRDGKNADELAIQMYEKSIKAGYSRAMLELRKTYEGEILLGRNQKRIDRLASILKRLSSAMAGYLPPAQSESLEISQKYMQTLTSLKSVLTMN